MIWNLLNATLSSTFSNKNLSLTYLWFMYIEFIFCCLQGKNGDLSKIMCLKSKSTIYRLVRKLVEN